MRKLLPLLTLLVVLFSLAGCSWGKKKKPATSSHLYEGDGPSIHYNDQRETAGGQFNPS